ncbi:hypothetical protein BG262_04485 [Floricoccus penangensis]|uniref:Clostridial hydrophobic W n=1 Tax=Floricoccus penangensis TaxID=1859475 RepID=A0A9Q5NZC9_9LACT|nr:Ig domain-containing protein [Floricoccus penangensis]OFI46278.1 hypothetical protein BG262_04485 [Floricoccus penangensis]
MKKLALSLLMVGSLLCSEVVSTVHALDSTSESSSIVSKESTSLSNGEEFDKNSSSNSELTSLEKNAIGSDESSNTEQSINQSSTSSSKEFKSEETEESTSSTNNNPSESRATPQLAASGISPSVFYSTHVQNIGWQGFVKNGEMSGTSGRSFRLEAIRIELSDLDSFSGGVEYSTHVQNDGWQPSVKDGQLSGTSGRSLRLEAIKINLTGQISKYYDIYYRVHIQDKGWLNWTKNGAAAGSQGLSKRLEGIEIRLISKDQKAPSGSGNSFLIGNEANTPHEVKPNVEYSTHVQNIGWQNYKKNGDISGTSGRGLRLEGIKIKLSNLPYVGGISYSTHVQNIGWQNNVSNNQLSGTYGRSLRLEGIRINLTGEIANHYDVYYRVHIQDKGWLNWAKNGSTAGSQDASKRLEAIQIVIKNKSEKAPTGSGKSFLVGDEARNRKEIENIALTRFNNLEDNWFWRRVDRSGTDIVRIRKNSEFPLYNFTIKNVPCGSAISTKKIKVLDSKTLLIQSLPLNVYDNPNDYNAKIIFLSDDKFEMIIRAISPQSFDYHSTNWREEEGIDIYNREKYTG